jgi:hypothetical protein
MDNENIKNMNNSSAKINNMYKDLTYLDNYGGSVIIFIILVIILFLCYAYFQVMGQIIPLRDDWPAKRCSPKVIPFAGLINKPDDKTIVEYTGENFNYCLQNILTSITGEAVQPLTYITAGLNSLYEELFEALQAVRNMMANIRASMASIAEEILGRVLNIMTPIQTIIIAVVDSMQKVNGILTAGLYTSLGTYYALKSLLGAIVQFIIIILIILVGLILGMWILPFTWPIAMTMTAVFVSLAIPMAIIIAFMTDVLHVQTSMSIPGIPSKPSCFDKNTQLLMNDGTYKSILDIQVGEKLANENTVTAKMKLDASGSTMYNLNGLLVSGTHLMKTADNKWILVSSYTSGIQIEKYSEPFIYCLNTSSKEIHINGFVFADWDELDITDIAYLLGTRCANLDLVNSTDSSNIHRYLDGGFFGDTIITMFDGSNKQIKDIQVGDKLNHGENVFGLVEIDSTTIDYVSLYDLGPMRVFKGGPNLNICDKSLNFTSTLDLDKNRSKVILNRHSDKIYHLLTDTESFYLSDLKFYHYNSNIELFLDRYHEKLLSMKYV